MAACAWSLRKWLIATAIFLFWQKVGLCMVRSRYFLTHTPKSGVVGFLRLSKSATYSSMTLLGVTAILSQPLKPKTANHKTTLKRDIWQCNREDAGEVS
jgi:hypothetical protein